MIPYRKHIRKLFENKALKGRWPHHAVASDVPTSSCSRWEIGWPLKGSDLTIQGSPRKHTSSCSRWVIGWPLKGRWSHNTGVTEDIP